MRRTRALSRVARPAGEPWALTGRAFEHSFLENDRALAAFFRRHRRRFFPGTDDLLAVRVERPATFSEDSRPVQLAVGLRLPDGRTALRSVRGNRVGRAGLIIHRRLFGRPNLLVPRPLWENERSGYLFYETLPGQTVRNLAFREQTLRPVFGRLGRLLARLHCVAARGVPPLRWRDETRFLELQARHIRAAVLPQRRELLASLAALTRWERRWWRRLPTVIAHNDFQASNLLVDRGRVGLIDFSRSGAGPLPIDAGTFLAHLTVMLAPAIGPAGRQRLRRVFLAAYRRRLTVRQRAALDRALPAFELRAALDIIGITCVHVRPLARNRILAPLLARLPAPPTA